MIKVGTKMSAMPISLKVIVCVWCVYKRDREGEKENFSKIHDQRIQGL